MLKSIPVGPHQIHQIERSTWRCCPGSRAVILEIFQEPRGAVAIAHEKVALHTGSPASLLFEIGARAQNVAGQAKSHRIIRGVNEIPGKVTLFFEEVGRKATGATHTEPDHALGGPPLQITPSTLQFTCSDGSPGG